MAIFDEKSCPLGGNARQDFDHELALKRAREAGGMRAWLAHVDASNLYKLNTLRDVVDIRIWRTHGDDALFKTHPNAKAWIDARLLDLQRAGIAPQDIWLSLNNEAGVPVEQAAWEAEAITHGLKYGLNFVPGNPSVGSPEPHEIARYRPVLELANEYPHRIIIGLHEYYYITHDNYNEAMIWHVGRGKNWRKYCDDNGLFAVRFGITEAGSDDLNDVNQRDPQKWARTMAPDNRLFNEFRGVHTLDEAYRQIFGHEYDLHGLGGLAAREMRRAWEKAWTHYADFALWFSVGEAYNSGWHGPTPWKAFNNEKLDDYWTYLAAWWQTRKDEPTPIPGPPPPPFPVPVPKPEPPEPPKARYVTEDEVRVMLAELLLSVTEALQDLASELIDGISEENAA